MRNVKARDLLAFSPGPPSVVTEQATLRDVVGKLTENPASREVYVVDDQDRFVGAITLRRLARFVFTSEVPDTSSPTDLLDMLSARTAGQMALKKASYVGEDDPLPQVVNVMFRYDINEIPVVDAERAIVGSLNMLEILAAWHRGRLDDLTGS